MSLAIQNGQKQLRLLIFDADKTLYDIDAKEAYEELYRFLSKKLNIPVAQIKEEHAKEIEKIKTSLDPAKRNYGYALEKVLRKHLREESTPILQEALNGFWSRVVKNLKPKKQVVETISSLSKQYILIIATDEFYSIVEQKLNKIFGNWRDYFHTIISCDKVGSMKPSERYYDEAMRLVNTSPQETVMIGDSWKRDLELAKKQGIKTILLAEQSEGSPDHVIRSPPELKKILLPTGV